MLVSGIFMTQFHFTLNKSRFFFLMAIPIFFIVWFGRGVLNPEETTNNFRHGSLLNNADNLFFISVFLVTIFLFAFLYAAVTMVSKLTLDIEKCSVSIEYYLLPKKIIYFESLDNLAVFQDEENLTEFGLYCAKQIDYYKPMYDSLGVSLVLSKHEFTEFMQLVKKHRLGERKFPWKN